MLIEATPGIAYANDELMSIAGNTTKLKHECNKREGLGVSYDRLSKGFFKTNEEDGTIFKAEM